MSATPENASMPSTSSPESLQLNMSRSLWEDAWRRLIRGRNGQIGMVIVVIVMLIAVVTPIVDPYDPSTDSDLTQSRLPPSAQHLFGTDRLGRDVFRRVMHGTRYSLAVALASIIAGSVLSTAIGMIAGYFGGWLDNVLMRIVDALLAFPALLLALTISAVLGPNLRNTIIAIGVAFTPYLARIIRGEALRVAQLPFVEAARAAGTNNLNMLIRHILPNVMPATIVQGTISLAFAILAEAGLSFLGLGTQPPQSSWGLMIQASRNYLDISAWTALVPGTAVALTVLGFNMFGDVLRDILDPRAK